MENTFVSDIIFHLFDLQQIILSTKNHSDPFDFPSCVFFLWIFKYFIFPSVAGICKILNSHLSPNAISKKIDQNLYQHDQQFLILASVKV